MTLSTWKALVAKLFFVTMLGSASLPALAAETPPLELGRIDFPTAGSGEAQEAFITGVLALHSFWYAEARRHFRRAQELDPAFGMAYWGEAMSYDYALLEPPAGSEEEGVAAARRMNELDNAGELEWTALGEEFADAVRERFNPDMERAQRRQAYADFMSRLWQDHQDHPEVTAFTALAVMALSNFDKENPSHVVSIAGRLEGVYERNRQHPGILHYLIHVYDSPTFARMGLRQARRYPDVAPASEHALHISTHTFRHLRMWEEVARYNVEAYETSLAWKQRRERPLRTIDFNSLEFAIDAYLRLEDYEGARNILDKARDLRSAMEQRGEDAGELPQVLQRLEGAYEDRGPGNE